MYRAVSARWPDSQTETTSEPETQTIHFQGTISTGEEEVPAAQLSDGRTIVDVTPEYLMGLFDKHTSIQAEKLVEAFIGKWIRLSGPLGDVMPGGGDSVAVVFTHERFQHRGVMMFFNNRATIENQLRVLRKGDQITVIGQIQRVFSASLELKNCELEKP